MLKQCPVCGRYFHHDTEEVCERCKHSNSTKRKLEVRRECMNCGDKFAPFHEDDHICPDCKRATFEEMTESERNKVYLEVRDFLYDNPLTPKVRVSERFGVPMRYIDDWINYGKIQQIDEIDLRGGGPENVCKFCGVKTHKGRICKPCEARMAEKLESHTTAVQRRIGRK